MPQSWSTVHVVRQAVAPHAYGKQLAGTHAVATSPAESCDESAVEVSTTDESCDPFGASVEPSPLEESSVGFDESTGPFDESTGPLDESTTPESGDPPVLELLHANGRSGTTPTSIAVNTFTPSFDVPIRSPYHSARFPTQRAAASAARMPSAPMKRPRTRNGGRYVKVTAPRSRESLAPTRPSTSIASPSSDLHPSS